MSPTARVERLLGTLATGELPPGPGLAALPAASPRSEEELVDLVQRAAREDLVLMPLGLGSKLGWTRPPGRVDLLVSTRELSGVVAYEPGDGTLTALAGTRMSELSEVVAAGGHHLTPDVPRADRATLGGTVAAGHSGIDRLRLGPCRHHVLGLRVVLADGTVTRTGGRLVKNVTGYDLHRLYCGSHGTLCVILEASLRLFPRPAACAALSADFATPGDALVAARAALAVDALPTAVCVASAGGDRPWTLHVFLDGRGEVVEEQARTIAPLLGGPRRLDGEQAQRLRSTVRDREPDAAAAPALRVTCALDRLAFVQPLVLERLARRGLAPEGIAHPGLASLDLSLAGADSAAIGALVRELRGILVPHRARVELRGAPWRALDDLDPFGEPGAAQPLMQRLRRTLDPRGRFATGRFHGGL